MNKTEKQKRHAVLVRLYKDAFNIPYHNTEATCDDDEYALPLYDGLKAPNYTRKQIHAKIDTPRMQELIDMFQDEMEHVHPRENTQALRAYKVEKLFLKIWRREKIFEEQQREAFALQDADDDDSGDEDDDSSDDDDDEQKPIKKRRKKRRKIEFRIPKKQPASPPSDPRLLKRARTH